MTIKLTGTLLDNRYKITGFLRSGRMGNVYVARRLEDNARFSVKILEPSLFNNPEAIRRFEREIRVQSKIQHPNCMAVFEAGRTESGLPWLLAEYFDGELLCDILEENGKLPPDRAVHIAGQIALAMEAAHDIGIIHRDLSTDNIMVLDGEESTVKVLDFGLAGVLDTTADEDTSLTAVGIRVGTPSYMAPEYIEDFECDHRADLYALGIILFELITGKPPFDGRPYKVMDKHVNTLPPRVSTIVPVSEWLDNLIATLLEKSPDARPPSARAVVALIENGRGRRFDSKDDLPQASMEAQAEAESTMIGASSRPDPVLDRFRESFILTLDRRTDSAPPARDCLVVERISKYSLPAQYGVTPGTMVQIAEQEEGLLDPTLLRQPYEHITYKFHVEGEQIRLKTPAALMGMTLARSVENIRTYYNPSIHGPESLLELWKQGAWEVLERLCVRTLSGGSALTQGLFAKFIGGNKPPPVKNHPATLFYGACLIETGRGDQGHPYVQEYKAKSARKWPTVYLAVATAYQGLRRIQAGKRDVGIKLLEDSYRLEPLQKIKRALERTKGSAPDLRRLYKQRFPNYNLVQTSGYPGANLLQTLSLMDDSQILLIALLGGFRANEDYNDFMMRYLNYATHLSEFIVGVHVCTTVKDRTTDHRPEWFTGEDLVAKSGLPLLILEDYRAFVQREAKPTRIPTVYAVNCDGIVLHEGKGTPTDIWNAIGRAGQLRMYKLGQA